MQLNSINFVNITRTRADYVRFSRLAFKRLGVSRYRLVASTLAIFLLFMLNEELNDNGWFRRHVLADYSAFFIAALLACYFILLNWFYRLFTRNVEFVSAGGNFLHPWQVAIDASGLRETSTFGTAFTNWAGIDRIEQTKDYLLFYIDRMQAYILPRRNFADPAQGDAFYGQARRYWEQARAETASRAMPSPAAGA